VLLSVRVWPEDYESSQSRIGEGGQIGLSTLSTGASADPAIMCPAALVY
jgi:hypothetical protein